jgi:hypothetical protein
VNAAKIRYVPDLLNGAENGKPTTIRAKAERGIVQLQPLAFDIK